MAQFRNLLVGVDLAQTYPVGSSQLSPPVEEAIGTAIWLAEKTNASLTFFTAIDVPLDSPYLHLIADDTRDLARELINSAQDRLAQLVRDAQAKGISAKAEVACGTGWVEILRRVLDHQHDLVIVGTRNLHGSERFLIGGTSRRLLRKCPSPIWVARPDSHAAVSNILVASDLQPVSEKALHTVAALASLVGAKIHLVHAVDYPLDKIWVAQIDARTEKYHERLRADARDALERQVANLGAAGDTIDVEIVDGVLGADVAILKYIEKHKIDLLVMGTVGRGGLHGMLIGNTAERLALQVNCSILAVKPDDFQCPVSLEPSGGRESVPLM